VPIYTVLGPIEPEQLGMTSMHEHLLCDARVWRRPSAEEPPPNGKVTMETLGYVRWNLLSMEDNLLLDDPELIAREAAEVKRFGGSGLVDLTIIGLGRRVADLPQIARATGLHVMVGCGFYVHNSHPEWLEAASVDEIRDFIVDELTNGIEDTGVVPTLIGEIGTNHPVTEREKKVLHAAAQAGVATGVSLNVHLSPRGADALEVLEILLEEGMRPERVIFSHMDERLDRGYHKAVAETGAVLEYDTFGSEFYYGDLFKNPTDVERLDYVRFLIDEGYEDQLVIGCDTWVKANLRSFGGMGYEHLFKRIVPAMRTNYGFSDQTIDTILVQSPRRLLERPAPDAAA
jgi:phosphotriesterase-related protein